jgi:hypothetical protein
MCLTQGLRFRVNAFSHVGRIIIPHRFSAAKWIFERTDTADTTSLKVVCQVRYLSRLNSSVQPQSKDEKNRQKHHLIPPSRFFKSHSPPTPTESQPSPQPPDAHPSQKYPPSPSHPDSSQSPSQRSTLTPPAHEHPSSTSSPPSSTVPYESPAYQPQEQQHKPSSPRAGLSILPKRLPALGA